MDRRLTVNYHGKPCYDIVFAASYAGLADELTALGLAGRRAVVVSDSNVAPLYADAVADVLTAAGITCPRFVFPAGEEQKTLDTARHLYSFLIEKRLSRHDFLVALGGGVVGDLCGFAASTYLRGIAYVNLPTTLLAQVDSSIGGKCGVDFDGYKNMVGSFYMPKLVYINVATLTSLPPRQFSSGFAEVMKHGLIRDAAFYEWLLTHMDAILERDADCISEMIYESCLIKKLVVEKDPLETGMRALLNFGHTIGHALENASGFALLHGEAVALGAVAAAFISWKKEYITTEEYYEIRDMFVPFGLPISVSGIDAATVLAYTKADKKSDGAAINFILLKRVGKAFIDRSVSEAEILAAVEEIGAENL